MIRLTINNNKVKIDCSRKYLLRLIKDFKIRHRNAYYIRAYMPRGWDGKIKYVSDAGYFPTGLLPKVVKYLKEADKDFEFDDLRRLIEPGKVPLRLGGLEARPYQIEIAEIIRDNYIQGINEDLYFPRGILKAATNAGKTFIMAMIAKMFNQKTICLINSKELFNDLLKDIPNFLPGKVGQISAKKIEWNDFMICMAPTTKNRIESYHIAKKIAEYPICLVDECDLSDNKTYKRVINMGLYNCFVKIGLSGTALMAQDKNKNEVIRGYFGEQLHEIRNRELMDKGYSSEVVVKILWGNEDPMEGLDYRTQYDLGIIKNKKRNRKIFKRVKINLKRKRIPALVIVKNHKHIQLLYSLFKRKLSKKYSLDWVHHKRPDRFEVVDRFIKGKIDILIGSLILKRGKNFPLMKYILNGGGGKGIENTLQILGRATRIHKSKKKTYFEDFYDEALYLRRHSKRRIIGYKNEQIKVIEKYKDDY